MKNKFEKQFNKEFNQTFTPNIDKEFLKEQLSIQPSSNTTTNVVFKKKVFVPLTILCTLLLIVLTSLTTWGVSKWIAYNNETPPVVDEEVDVVKMFQEKYNGANVQLVNKINFKNDIEISLIHIKTISVNLLVVYFNKIHDYMINQIKYEININGIINTVSASKNGDYSEFYIDYNKECSVYITLYRANKELFEFCTNF